MWAAQQGYANLETSLFLLESESEVAQLCPFLCDPWTVACTRLLHPWDFPGKSIGAGCHLLHQGIFPTQGIEPRSPASKADALPSEPPGKPLGNRNTFLAHLTGWGDCIFKTLYKLESIKPAQGFILLSHFPELHRALFSYLTTSHWGSQHLENESPLNHFWGVLVVKVCTVQQIRQKY